MSKEDRPEQPFSRDLSWMAALILVVCAAFGGTLVWRLFQAFSTEPLPLSPFDANLSNRFGCSQSGSKMLARNDQPEPAADLLQFVGKRRFRTILADPPWQFTNRTGKVAPEHRRLARYTTLTLNEITSLPVASVAADPAHLYLWVPNALLAEGMAVMQAWGFTYKSNIVWHKVRKDGGSDGRGVGFYFRNVTEMILFGVRGKNARTLAPGRTQVNYFATRKREHSRKPDEQYPIIEACSPGPYLELFARGTRSKWVSWGNQADAEYAPSWATYSYNSRTKQSA